MRIEYIKLKNFTGIYDGTGKKEIEVIFPHTNNTKILLLGQNGSGKSTLLSTLHPFAETFDDHDRSDIIIEGEEGYKEIHIRNGDDVFVIKHHYGKKNKSFIEKNGEELNEAGGLRTFSPLVEQELGVTENHFKLIKVGSSSQNFIDLNSSARKSFIGKFMPDIEEYLNAYAIVNNKFNTFNKEIKYLSGELSKIDDKENVDKNIKIQSSIINKHKKMLEDILESISNINAKTNQINENLKSNIDDIKEYEDVMSNLVYTISKIQSIENVDLIELSIDELEEIIKSLKDSISILNTELEKNKLNRKNIEDKISSSNVDVKNLNAEILKYSSEDDDTSNLDSLKVVCEELTKVLNTSNSELTKTIKDMPSITSVMEKDVVNNKDSFDYDSLLKVFSPKFNSFFEAVKTARENINISLNGDEVFLTFKELSKLKIYIDNLNKTYESDSEALTKLTSKYNKLKIEVRSEEIYKDRFSMCQTPGCKVFELNSVNLNNENELTNLENKISKNTKNLKDQKDYIDLSNSYLYYVNRIDTLFNTSIIPTFKYFANLNELVEYKNNEGILLLAEVIRTSDIDALFYIEDELYYVHLLSTININTIKLDNVKEKIKLYSNVSSLVKTKSNEVISIKAKIKEYTTQLDSLNKENIILKNEITETVANLPELVDILALKTDEKEFTKTAKTLKKIYVRNKSDIDLLKELENQLALAKENKVTIEEQLDEASNLLDSYKLKQIRIKEFNDRYTAIINSKAKYQYIKEALDIKTGIPLVLLSSYLNEIKYTTNLLLNLAFKGNFMIDFEINDSEFNIPITKANGKKTKDIIMCSQGQRALVKTSLSLGIISQSINDSPKKYNLIYCDEIDAELDTKNKYSFLEILNAQLTSLDCEQCFIITHNDAFTSADVDLILMEGANVDVKDKEFMANKTLIKDFRRVQ